MADMEPAAVKQNRWIAIAALHGFCAVAMGAIGAHLLDDPAQVVRVQQAALYQLIHAGVLVTLVLASGYRITRWCFALGLLLFCGSLYGKALLGWPAVVAPAGGLLLLAGWFWLAIAGFSGRRRIQP